MTLDEQLKLAESGHTPILDEEGRVTGWKSPVYVWTEPLGKDNVHVKWQPILDDHGQIIGFYLDGIIG